MSVKEKKRRRTSPPPDAAPGSPPASRLSFLERRAPLLIAALIALGTFRIVATYSVFDHTFDEPAHVACGMEWLDKGTYTWEPQHPPLARVAVALGPYLTGVRSQGTRHTELVDMTREGLAILYSGRHYDTTLTAARLGVLPFFWIASLVVWWWGRRYLGTAAAVIAVFCFTFLEPVLAHSGLATTDMALTAFLGAAFLAGAIWLEQPSVKTGAWFGIATGLCCLSKFSTFVFFPAAVAAALLWYFIAERPSLRTLALAVKERLPSFGLAVLIACVLIWAGYRFSFGDAGFGGLKLPAPELFQGIRDVAKHNAEGHPSYVLGHRSRHGFWYFYLVVMAFKTPLALLLLVAAGIALAPKQCRLAIAYGAGIIGVSFFSHINIGVRHILPVYMAFALIAGAAAVALYHSAQKWARYGLGAAVLWFGVTSLISHPDYLAYFNELAGSHPENVLVDSDLDWGQDYKRLATFLRQAGANHVTFQAFTLADLEGQHGFPPVTPMDVLNPLVGWNATGVTIWKARRLGLYEEYPDARLWPDYVKPTQKIGKSIYVWYFLPPSKGAR